MLYFYLFITHGDILRLVTFLFIMPWLTLYCTELLTKERNIVISFLFLDFIFKG